MSLECFNRLNLLVLISRPPRRGGGVNACLILTKASLNFLSANLWMILKRVEIQHTNLTSDGIALMLTTYLLVYLWQNCISLDKFGRWECLESTDACAQCALICLRCLDVKPLSFQPKSLFWQWSWHLSKESLIWTPGWSAWSRVTLLMLES